MNVEFYNFSKRKNSTKQPSSSTGTQKTFVCKENTSIHNPVVQVDGSVDPSFTYAHISTWGKYYYVEDAVTVANGISEYTLREDPMASNKTGIGSTKAYIKYSASQIDRMIIDDRLAHKSSKTVMGSGDMDSPVFDSTGCYVLSVLADTSSGLYNSACGMATCYAMDQANMEKVAGKLCDATISQALTNFMNGDLMSAILGCIWVPFPIGTTNVTEIKIGNQHLTGINAYMFPDFTQRQGTFQIPIFLRYDTTDFRSYEPYTTGVIYLPGIGNIDLNMSDWYGSEYINVSVTQEWLTGNCTYLLFHDNGALIQSATCNVASQCPLGTIRSKEDAAGYSLLGAVGAAAVGSVGGAVAALGSAILAFTKHAASIGGSMGGRGCQLWPYISHVEWSIDTEDPQDLDYITHMGGPCGGVDLISNHTGFLQCEGASVDIAGSEEERDEINAIINAGFYYE